jgi:predicted DsbA family dithiol-disulfide isomerase
VLLAMKCALASPRVTATAIEANEFPRLAEEMEVWAVPRIVVNGAPQWDGAVPERVFLQRVLSAAYG